MKLRISVQGNTYDVDVEILENGSASHAAPAAPLAAAPAPRPAPAARPAPAPAPAATPTPGGASSCKAPIAGTIMSIKVKPGDTVSVNQVLVVMEAMKMETNIASPVAGKVRAVPVNPGEAVKAGQLLVEFE